MSKNRRTAFARRFSDARSKITSRTESLFDLIDAKESDLGPGPYRGVIIEASRKPTGRIDAWIRLVDTNDYQIPTACSTKSSNKSKIYKICHIAATSKFLDNNTGDFDENEYVQREVEVTFANGSPNQSGKSREAQFSLLPAVTSEVITKNAQFCYVKDDGTTTGKLSDRGYKNTLGSTGTGKNKWKGRYIIGSTFPDDKIDRKKKISINKWIKDEYLPVAAKVFKTDPKGMRLLAEIHAIKEGFYPRRLKNDKKWLPKRKDSIFKAHFSHKDSAGKLAPGKEYSHGETIPKGSIYTTRAYRCSNPGNIGNTDSGDNVWYPSLEKGIKKQKKYFLDVVAGKNKAYPIGRTKTIKPYTSPEIAAGHYGDKSPHLPGYKMGKFTASLEQYVKVYATGARSSNSYLSMIISYFANNGLTITEKMTIEEIIKMNT